MSDESAYCDRCRRPLSRDEIALTKKLVNRGATKFLCVTCLASAFHVDAADVRQKAADFREMGCALFTDHPPDVPEA